MAGDSTACVSSVAAETIEDSSESSKPTGGSSIQQVHTAVREKATVWEEHPRLRDEVSCLASADSNVSEKETGHPVTYPKKIPSHVVRILDSLSIMMRDSRAASLKFSMRARFHAHRITVGVMISSRFFIRTLTQTCLDHRVAQCLRRPQTSCCSSLREERCLSKYPDHVLVYIQSPSRALESP